MPSSNSPEQAWRPSKLALAVCAGAIALGGAALGAGMYASTAAAEQPLLSYGIAITEAGMADNGTAYYDVRVLSSGSVGETTTYQSDEQVLGQLACEPGRTMPVVTLAASANNPLASQELATRLGMVCSPYGALTEDAARRIVAEADLSSLPDPQPLR